jgi:starch synthase (maltosyl-transferring)
LVLKDNESIEGRKSPDFLDIANKTPTSTVILNVSPQVDCGRFPAKRIVGDTLTISADILKPGHELLIAFLNWRMKGDQLWKKRQLSYFFDADSWSTSFNVTEAGVCEFFIEAWKDNYSTKIQDARKWIESGENATSDIVGLVELANSAALGASPSEKVAIKQKLNQATIFGAAPFSNLDVIEIFKLLSDNTLSALVTKNLDREEYTSTRTYQVIFDRNVARYSAWYEMFHRSQGTVENKGATFKDCELRLGEIQQMGFDVIYLPPIHPIGHTNRRGPNNTTSNSELDPGSLWAIGNEFGGHDAINPELGNMEDFLQLVSQAKKQGMEIALDLAFQVSPDHPYVKENPKWFYYQYDGKIRYAENPPKKYYDIYPLYFENGDWKRLWEELYRIVVFWIEKGIRIFRVDNPHTKPVMFWEWLISKVRSKFPDVIFFSEAFTRPKSMKLLAKSGFDLSYTYFTWKNSKDELTEFIEEYFLSNDAEYYRPNLFTNTPDILPEFLQTGGRPAFKIRETLAGTLSSCYGIYNSFELCEGKARIKGSEDYLDSEKYQFKVWDWDRPGNIKNYISKINRIRRENPALQVNSNLRLLKCDSDQILFYGKWTEDLSNVILVAVNLDPFSNHETSVTVPVKDLDLDGTYLANDLISGKSFTWTGEKNYVKLDPKIEPAHILKLEKHF